jgi:hypothetical protein
MSHQIVFITRSCFRVFTKRLDPLAGLHSEGKLPSD